MPTKPKSAAHQVMLKKNSHKRSAQTTTTQPASKKRKKSIASVSLNDLYCGKLTLPSIDDIGKMDNVCSHCSAHMWKHEIHKGSLHLNAKFSTCCSQGKITIPALLTPPETLKTLLTENTTQAKYFRQNIRAFNSSLAFSSLVHTHSALVVQYTTELVSCFQNQEKIQSSEPVLFVALENSDGLISLDLNNGDITVIVDGLGNPAIDYHTRLGLLYYTDLNTRALSRIRYPPNGNTASPEIIIQAEDDHRPSAVAVDSINNLIYWADDYADSITKADLCGLNQNVILQDSSIHNILGIALDVENSVIYFTDNGAGKIEKSDWMVPTDKLCTQTPTIRI
ncbi:unnamed protein product [Mytilus edulis]|uniref:Uncharacterized protein n=1 Tax=Mytilus edulis TaxID=6550 RepID=A0A8S3SAR3_MYTED|nr:unnamed protein product [Mytilus edulis]